MTSRKPPPRFRVAVLADARRTAALRGDRPIDGDGPQAWWQIALLTARSDALIAQILYRVRCALARRGVPLLPRLAHRLAMTLSQVCIGDPVVIGAGLYLPHGQVVIDGIVEIGPNATISPWVTIGLQPGELQGPTIGPNVQIGTGAKIVGPVTIGANARIGANAVVLDDVAPDETVVGAPARPR